jgi:diaminopimelate epimerase
MRGTTEALSVSPGFFKGHGLGNDYLVMEEGEGLLLDADAIRAICHRRRGVGADGIVVVLAEGGRRVCLRMFNPDGSEFERSGNGLRILASYLARSGRAGDDWFPVSVGGGEVALRVHGATLGGVFDVSVDMGTASFEPEAVHLATGGLDAEGRLRLPEGRSVAFTPVSMGNPHCVVFTEDLSHEALEELGPALSGHEAFERGVNVQLVRPLGPGIVEIRIWERGVGPTSASGTSACAAAAASVRKGLAGHGVLRVRSPGGEMKVTVERDWRVLLRAPVQEVCEGLLAPGFVDSLA